MSKDPKWKDVTAAKLFGFWSYDSFPFVLGGAIKEMHDDGTIAPHNYQGMAFKPLKIIPEERGQEILQKLKQLEAEHRAAERKLKKEFCLKVVEAMGQEAKSYRFLQKILEEE